MKIKFLLLAIILLVGTSLSLDAQNITYQIDGERLYLSENGDCSSGPDPRWRIRTSTQYTGWANWNRDVDDISGSGWHNYTNYSWVNNTSVPNNAVITVQLDAWEEDPWTCDACCGNGGPDDGDCFGYGTVSTRTITDAAPCGWRYYSGTRSCRDDGTTITWGVEYSYYYTYNDLYPGSIGGGGSYYACSDPPAFTNTGSATKWATYQWQQSTNGGATWTNIGGATGTTYNPGPLSVTTQFRRRVNDCSGRTRYSNVRTITILSNGNPGTFGNNVWNVYAYNGRSLNLSAAYQGYYVDNNLSVNTLNFWTSGGTPSSASGYVGCTVGTDNHTTVHKRQGFPCGTYRIDVAGHDDEIRIYVNGGQVFEHIGCCDAHNGIWTGILGSSSTIEIRTAEGGGGSNTRVNVVNITPPLAGGTVSNNQTICSGATPSTLTSTVGATGAGTINYQWQSSPNNSTWTNIGGATGATYSPPSLTSRTYYRRRSIDECGNTRYSNTITINIHPALVAGSVSTNQTICSGATPTTLSSTANATGGGGFNYQWQSSPNNSTWTNIGGATGATYSPPALTSQTYYRRRAISNCSETLYTNTITISIHAPLNAGSINSNQTICSGATPTTLTSNSNATGGNGFSYQWQSRTTGGWSNIGGATGTTYSPSSLTETTEYRRRAVSNCGETLYTNTITINTHPALNVGSIAGDQTTCAGSALATLTSTANATGGNGFTYQWQSRTTGSWSNIGGATSATYAPSALTETTEYRRRAISNCSETLYTNIVTITIQTLSTAPVITPLAGKVCPNTDFVLTVSGGTVGTGSTVEWYSDAAGTISIGSGNSLTVSTNSTATYYVRREGTCNTTSLTSITATIRDYAYTPVGNVVSSNYCDDNTGWRHFFDSNDDIILSVLGNFSGLTSMSATVNNNGVHHQERESASLNPNNCANGWSPGEERFELPRYWNIDYTGTLNGGYRVRYYFPASEKANLITAVNNFMTTWTDCNYAYKHPYPDGFYWFKNTGTPYANPQFEGNFLTGTGGSVNGINYSEISGITTFSGGSGAVIIIPTGGLPVELVNFAGENKGQVNLLNWTTETELNNARFEIEHSLDPSSGFEQIGELAGAGTTQEIQHYNFSHNTPALGVNYYRLKQVDFDGEISYSDVIAIIVKLADETDMFYPNPTENIVNYQFNETVEQEITIIINNTLGQEVGELHYNSKIGVNSMPIDLSAYPAGAYMIKVTKSETKHGVTKRVIRVE
ncbi:MAG: T9SS type A sorting domain-containing protein [Aureispira sp.]|nr:T9SS type A sorting domain-containing protein [Aureispira sp.]